MTLPGQGSAQGASQTVEPKIGSSTQPIGQPQGLASEQLANAWLVIDLEQLPVTGVTPPVELPPEPSPEPPAQAALNPTERKTRSFRIRRRSRRHGGGGQKSSADLPEDYRVEIAAWPSRWFTRAMLGGRTASRCALLVIAAACAGTSGGGSTGSPGSTSSTGSKGSAGSTGATSSSGSGGSAGSTAGAPPDCSPPCGRFATCNPDGTCTCYPNYVNCPGSDGGTVCSNVHLDNDNCGGCGTPCPPGTGCLGGVCACYLTSCVSDAGEVVCTDPLSDPMNCGGCNQPCTPPATQCENGTCQ